MTSKQKIVGMSGVGFTYVCKVKYFNIFFLLDFHDVKILFWCNKARLDLLEHVEEVDRQTDIQTDRQTDRHWSCGYP